MRTRQWIVTHKSFQEACHCFGQKRKIKLLHCFIEQMSCVCLLMLYSSSSSIENSWLIREYCCSVRPHKASNVASPRELRHGTADTTAKLPLSNQKCNKMNELPQSCLAIVTISKLLLENKCVRIGDRLSRRQPNINIGFDTSILNCCHPNTTTDHSP